MEKKERVTKKELIEVIRRLNRCENHAQTCYAIDHMPDKIKTLLEE